MCSNVARRNLESVVILNVVLNDLRRMLILKNADISTNMNKNEKLESLLKWTILSLFLVSSPG